MLQSRRALVPHFFKSTWGGGALRRQPRFFGLRPGGASPLPPGAFLWFARIIYAIVIVINNSGG